MAQLTSKARAANARSREYFRNRAEWAKQRYYRENGITAVFSAKFGGECKCGGEHAYGIAKFPRGTELCYYKGELMTKSCADRKIDEIHRLKLKVEAWIKCSICLGELAVLVERDGKKEYMNCPKCWA